VLRRGLEAGLPYVGLVASPKRGTGVLAELRGDGVPEEQLARIDVPAGLDIGARTPAEIALSILAKIVAVRREERTAAAEQAPSVAAGANAPDGGPLAIDPVCGMTVAAVDATPHIAHDGETVYFCCEGCKAAFEGRREHAGA
jgi:xanthine dehydrogenase accessory factor